MSDIDEDIRETANRYATEVLRNSFFGSQDEERMIAQIVHLVCARAIKAERERCARIAERSTPYRILPSGDGATYTQFPGKGTLIAAAIRTPDRDDGE